MSSVIQQMLLGVPAAVKAFVQKGAIANTGSAGTLTPALPTGRTTGHLLISFIGMPRASRTFTYAGGWTEFDHISGTDHSGSLAYRYVDGTEADPTITIVGGTGPTAAQVFEFTGTVASSPIGATHHSEVFGTSITDAGVTSTASGSLIAVFCVGASGSTTLSTPSGYTIEASVSGSANGTIGSWDQTLGASGSASTAVAITGGAFAAYGTYSVEIL